MITKNKYLPVVGMALALTYVGQAFSSVTYTADNRFVSRNADLALLGAWSEVLRPDTPFSDWDGTSQASSMGANGFTANGSGDAFDQYPQGWSISSSIFDINFSLTTDTDLELTGFMDSWDGWNDSVIGYVSLYDGTGNVLYNQSVSSFNSFENILFSSLLGAGDYRFIAASDPFFTASGSSYDVQVSLTSVPVPAAVWLFGSGLIGLAGFAKRKYA